MVDKNDRAVTEWRFRRNHGLNYPYLFENHVRVRLDKFHLINFSFFCFSLKSNRFENSDIDDYKQMNEMKFNEKKFIIPELIYPRSE